jgi:hypothetical protein
LCAVEPIGELTMSPSPMKHAQRRHGVHHHFVQTEARLRAGARFDDAFEHEVLGDAEFLEQDMDEALIEVARMDVGEKAEPAEIDAENGNLTVTHLPGRAENGAVAAEDEGEIGARERRQVLLLAQIDQQHLGLFAQERQPALDLRDHAWPFCVSEHVNLHRVNPRSPEFRSLDYRWKGGAKQGWADRRSSIRFHWQPQPHAPSSPRRSPR